MTVTEARLRAKVDPLDLAGIDDVLTPTGLRGNPEMHTLMIGHALTGQQAFG